MKFKNGDRVVMKYTPIGVLHNKYIILDGDETTNRYLLQCIYTSSRKAILGSLMERDVEYYREEALKTLLDGL